MLEADQHTDNVFITLTYSDENLPEGGTLVPKHAQDWLKRFRKAIDPVRVRYFLVGEYGDASQRPHYHAVIFGFPLCERGQSRFDHRSNRCCRICDLVRDTWGMGNVHLGSVGMHSAQYCAGYTVKKFTAGHYALNGRHPEFARMSLRPGIGADALHEIASELMRLGLDTALPDVPSGMRHGAKILPLGTYLRRRLRTLIGKDAKAPPETLAEMAEKLRPLYEAAFAGRLPAEVKALAFFNAVVDEERQKVASMEARAKIFKSQRRL